MTVQEWVDGYAQAWRDRDADAAAALFAADSTYRDHPTAEAHRGPDGVRAYWANITSTQENPDVRMGAPIVSGEGRRAAVEFWVRMLNSGQQVTVIGILFLRFAEDGLCEELRETWNFEPGDFAPPDDWGS
jgi:nuclear transport factor 2 (NTF2) superfamily protein